MRAKQSAANRVASATRQALRRHRGAVADAPLIAAVSGGADSLAMLLSLPPALRVRQPDGPSEIIVAHFSHGLRPTADRREAALVEGIAGMLGFAFVRGQAGAMRGTGEAAARDARYSFLASVAHRYGASAVALAHTLDDQAETVLLRLARGTGLHGAGAIREWMGRTVDGKTVALLRPMLAVGRADTAAACAEAEVTPARDASNRLLRFGRNRVRHRVLPELERVSRGAHRALARFAQDAQADDDLLEALAQEAVKGVETREEEAVRWPRAALAGLPAPLLTRVAQSAWRYLRGEGAALSAAQLAAVARLLRTSSGGESVLPDGFRFAVDQRQCRLGRETQRSVLPPEGVSLTVPGTTVAGPWRFTVRAQAGPGRSARDPLARSQWCAVLDADAVEHPVLVRARRPGDRFQPMGMPSEGRLQDVLVNAKVPRGSRATLPLLVTQRGIAWVAGVRVADWARTTDATKRVLVICAESHGAMGPSSLD